MTMDKISLLHSKYMKEINRVTSLTEKYQKALVDRKGQLSRWNEFFQKLLSEGRITKEELKAFSPRKEKK